MSQMSARRWLLAYAGAFLVGNWRFFLEPLGHGSISVLAQAATGNSVFAWIVRISWYMHWVESTRIKPPRFEATTSYLRPGEILPATPRAESDL
jgi:hypothetical protein